MTTRDNRSNLSGDYVMHHAFSTNTSATSAVVDTADYESIKFDFICPDYTDGTYTPTIYHSDDSGMAGSVAVPSTSIIGTLAGAVITAASAAGSSLKSIGIIGTKRYVQITITSTSVTTGGTIDIVAQKSPRILPVSDLSA